MRAYDSGETDADELATALKRYDDLKADEKAEIDELLAVTDDDTTELLAEADDDTLELIADGSGDVDEAFDRALTRAHGNPEIDDTTLDGAEKVVKELQNSGDSEATRLAKDAFAQSPKRAGKFLDTFGTDRWRRLASEVEAGTVSEDELIDFVTEISGSQSKIKALRSGVFDNPDVDADDFATFIRATNGNADRFANDLLPANVNRLVQLTNWTRTHSAGCPISSTRERSTVTVRSQVVTLELRRCCAISTRKTSTLPRCV